MLWCICLLSICVYYGLYDSRHSLGQEMWWYNTKGLLYKILWVVMYGKWTDYAIS
jgi:hypothetical protein